MRTNQDAQTLEETLNRTDLGHMVNQYKKLILMAAAFVVLGIIAYSLINQQQVKKRLVILDKAYEVEQEVFANFLKDKKNASQFLEAMKGIDKSLVGHPNLIPSFIESLNKLGEKNQVTPEIIAVAARWQKNIRKSNLLNLFMSIKLASLYEDAGKIDKAIKSLELLVSNSSKIMKDKIHFDLGRLYLKKGDAKTAKERFDVILNDKEKSNTEYAKLAKLYLSEI